MRYYILKRLINTIPIIIIVSILVFLFIHLIPGDPARLLAGHQATLEEIMIMRDQLGSF